MFTKWYQQKQEQEAWGLHGKHEEEATASLGVFSSNSGGLRAEVRGPYFSNMLRSSSSSLFALWSICENEGWRGR
jgi:hypothetical protein